jgi:hypothetical protein
MKTPHIGGGKCSSCGKLSGGAGVEDGCELGCEVDDGVEDEIDVGVEMM